MLVRSEAEVTMLPLLAVDVSFGYNSKPILSSLSFKLAAGTITCLMGGNGVGKTTLFNILSGYLTSCSGKVIVHGRDCTKAAPFEICRAGISRTFQDLRLIPGMTVQDNLRLSFRKQPSESLGRALLPQILFRKESRLQDEKTRQLIDIYQLNAVAEQRADSISFGQQKLLSLACCEASGGTILLLDEPAAGIHIFYQRVITDRLQQLASAGCAILVIEHQSAILKALGQEFLLIRNGMMERYSDFESVVSAQRKNSNHD